jgi:hypothetical protein
MASIIRIVKNIFKIHKINNSSIFYTQGVFIVSGSMRFDCKFIIFFTIKQVRY